MKITYKDYNPKPAAIQIISQANEILDEYSEQGFSLTLRQLYYQFVARDLFPSSFINKEGTKNNVQSYKKLGNIISSAREAGYVDWYHITDRGRKLQDRPRWAHPRRFLEDVVHQFNIDMWKLQNQRVEVWVEKDALSDVVLRACDPLHVPVMACKGYMSASAMWEAAYCRMRENYYMLNQPTVILHLGDHDPSGVDMTRDIQERLNLFSCDCPIHVNRIALTMEQIEDQCPPPNPAKETDPRSKGYRELYGNESWELDALEPSYIVDLITDHVLELQDPVGLEMQEKVLREYQDALQKAIDEFGK